MRSIPIKKITFAAVLTAIALTIFIIEARIPALLPIPGIKLGLSNIVTLFALYALGPAMALYVLVCRVVLGALVTGQPMAILYSLSGGLAALGFSTLMYRKFPPNQVWVLSVLAAVLHNLGQIAVAILITHTAGLVMYIPVLIVSGIVAGAFTGVAAQALLHKLTQNGLMKP